MKAALAGGAATAIVPGLAAKRCHNVFLEPNPNDPANPFILIETPGSLKRYNYSNAIRGMWQADGHASGQVLIAHGTQFATYNTTTNLPGTITGPIPGTDRGDFAFTETQGFGLFNGSLYLSTGTAISIVTDANFADLLNDAGESVFTSVDTMGQRGLFTFGPRFGFTDVANVNSVTALSYYTAESFPDDIIAGKALGEFYYLFGTRTIEVWAQTTDSDDPFALQPGLTQQIGCMCRDGIVRADNSLFFIDDKAIPRRLGQGGSQVINPNDPWVTDALKAAGAANIIGQTYSDKAHVFIRWRMPDVTIVYDVLTQKWHTVDTNEQDTSRYTSMIQAGTRVFVGDELGQFDELSREYASESMANVETMGTEIAREFTAHLANVPKRAAIKTVRLECAKGVGLANGQGSAPIVRMRQSRDGGNTWTNWATRSLGAQGVYDRQTIWRRRGRAKDRGVIFHFLKTDPVIEAYQAVVVNEDQLA